MKSILRASVNCLPIGVRHRIKHIPGLAGLQRWLVDRVLSGDPFTHTINGGPAAGLTFDIVLPLDKAIWAGTYEADFAMAISRGVMKGDVCYDVGGYRGYMSGIMALAGASKVIVFEPLPANQSALHRLCDLNPALNIVIEPIALGNEDGIVQLRVMPDSSMGKLVSSKFQSNTLGTGEIDVRIRSLDSMVRAMLLPPPQIIKIDVEGAELDVLLGAAELLKRDRPLVYLEAHSASLERACSRELEKYDYSIHRIELDPGDEEQTRHLIASPEKTP